MRKDLNTKKIIALYQAGKSLNQISIYSKAAPLTIRKLLVRNGVNINSSHSFNRTQKKCHNLTIDYFKKIDSNEKAYWLGILISDGTIQKYGYKTSLTSKDRDLIFNLKQAIKSTYPITKIRTFDKRTQKTYVTYMIQINSKEFTSYIIDLGVTNRKSYVCTFPKIKEKFYLSFLRGLFDGDGSLTVQSKNSLRMSFTATKEIIEFIQQYFKDKFKIAPHPIYRTSDAMNVFRTHYFSDTKKILSLLYKNSNKNCRLNRKYKLYVKS